MFTKKDEWKVFYECLVDGCNTWMFNAKSEMFFQIPNTTMLYRNVIHTCIPNIRSKHTCNDFEYMNFV